MSDVILNNCVIHSSVRFEKIKCKYYMYVQLSLQCNFKKLQQNNFEIWRLKYERQIDADDSLIIE